MRGMPDIHAECTPESCRILLVCGSLRSGSSNAAALRTARIEAPQEATTVVYQRLGDLPHFNPDIEQAGLPEPVIDLRVQLGLADAVLFSTPEYAGALPGSFKNLLDWCVGEGLYQKPVGWVNPSPHERGAERTYDMLRSVLSYVNAEIVERACVRAPVRRDAVGEDGTVRDPAARSAIREAVAALVEHALHSVRT